MVYEEVNFPEATYQFGFVNEAGQLVNQRTLTLPMITKVLLIEEQLKEQMLLFLLEPLPTNQSATTVGDLKNVTLPATSIARPTEEAGMEMHIQISQLNFQGTINR